MFFNPLVGYLIDETSTVPHLLDLACTLNRIFMLIKFYYNKMPLNPSNIENFVPLLIWKLQNSPWYKWAKKKEYLTMAQVANLPGF